jgi:hypothetical protein
MSPTVNSLRNTWASEFEECCSASHMSPAFIDISALRGTRAPPHPWLTPFGSPEELEAMPPAHRDQILFLDTPSTAAAAAGARWRGPAWGRSPS